MKVIKKVRGTFLFPDEAKLAGNSWKELRSLTITHVYWFGVVHLVSPFLIVGLKRLEKGLTSIKVTHLTQPRRSTK